VQTVGGLQPKLAADGSGIDLAVQEGYKLLPTEEATFDLGLTFVFPQDSVGLVTFRDEFEAKDSLTLLTTYLSKRKCESRC